MSEQELDDMLVQVNDAVSHDGNDVVWLISPPLAMNDNDSAWPLEPFPEGWHASP